jgi:maleylpyruvate isomerase
VNWLTELDRVFQATLDRVPDEGFAEPTELPGWTRAHVIAHVHFNALALCRLVGWASSGVEAAMYESAAQRAEEIERGSLYGPERLRQLVGASAHQFSTSFRGLTGAEADRVVVTAQGRRIPARELGWLRCRELGVHAVDLDAGTSFDDLPDGFTDALVEEIVAKRLHAGEGARLAALLTGRNRSAPSLDRWL